MQTVKKRYACKVTLCAGRECTGDVTVYAETAEDAEEKAYNYVSGKLKEILPELGIDVEIGKAKEVLLN